MTKKLLFQNGLALFVCLFLFAGASFAQTQTAQKLFSTTGSTTWSLPTNVNVTSVTIEAIGGGGGGGSVDGYNSSLFRSAGGGSGAAYAKTTLTSFSQGQTFNIYVGDGGVNTPTWNGSNLDALTHISGSYSYSATNGGASYVSVNGSVVVRAAGGVTVSGRNNMTGANALAASQSTGTVVHIGGNGSNAYASNEAEWQVTSAGSGGGAGGANTNGGNGSTSTNLDGNNQGGAGGGGNAGNGGKGEGTWNSVPSSNAGQKYGGGGSGAWCTGINWSQTGGKGGAGMVLITYTYTDITTQSVSVTDASANVCSGADFDVTLNITAEGFNLNEAIILPAMVSNPSISISLDGPSFTNGQWHITGSTTNFSSNTIAFPITVTVTTPDGSASDNATITLNVYGKLDGGAIARDQFVCGDQEIDILKGDGSVVTDPDYGNLTTAEASGGSGAGTYQWYAYDNIDGYDYQPITGANANNYTPSNGYYHFKREYVDEACGSAWAANAYFVGDYYIVVITVNPLELTETGFSEDTICSNEPYTHTLDFSGTSPAAYWFDGYILQESLDKGATWINVGSDQFNISLTPDEFSAGDDIWYRFAYVFGDCDPYPGNSIHKIHVKEVPSYNGQFPDVNITLWYGACDTNIANMTPPTLTPTPADIFGPFRAEGLRLEPGTHTITWNVKPDEDCEIYDTYEQTVIVEYPICGTLDEPYVITDRYGYEYNTIRIGCDCWLAENLRTNADNATYYDDDEANEAFGRLYDWNDAVGSFNTEMETKLGTTYIQGVCPMGWAVPTVAQYNTMMSVAGTAEDVKSDDENAWLPDMVGTNTSGFAAMGAGYFSGMQYQRLLGYTDFWTADLNESNTTLAKAMELRVGCDDLLTVDKNKADKLSLRCVKVEPLSYININIAFDMNDEWGDGWDGGAYLLAEYGGSSVKLFLDREHGTHFENTLPVPQGSDVTLTWSQGNSDYEISITVTNTETEEVLYHIENLSGTADGEELTTFHVDGHSNPADLQLVDFVLKQMFSGYWNNGSFSSPSTGFLQVDYGTGVLNLSKVGYGSEDHAIIALPVGAHIQLNWVGYTTGCYFTVQYPDGTVIYDTPTVDEGPIYEFDVVKH